MRIKRNPLLVKSIIDKTNISTVNELLEGKKQSEVANNYDITQGRVSQIWGDFQNELLEKYNNGISKQTLIEEQVEKGINLTMESLNEIIPEDFNKLIIGDCLKELQIDKEIHTRPSPFKLWLFEYF